MTQADNRIPNHFAIVACADHVARGVAGGFMQVNHGKLSPLRRIRPGDTVVAYSPTKAFGIADDLKSFSAFGVVLPGEPYQFDMGGGFKPHPDKVVSSSPATGAAGREGDPDLSDGEVTSGLPGESLDPLPAPLSGAPGMTQSQTVKLSFKPFRRDVHWAPTRPASIRPLLDRLDLTSGVANWGYRFRFGVISLSEADARLIGEAMALPADWLDKAA